MKITITTIGFDLSDSVREYTEKKVGKLDKYFANHAEARAVLKKGKNYYRAEINVIVGGDIYRGECTAEDENLFTAINSSVSYIERQFRKHKSLLKKQQKQHIILPIENEEEEEKEFPITRNKTLKLKPMSSDEAILQMHMTDHNWFVYLDETTNRVSVVYFRRNGGYGIMSIEE